jgi:peptide/nickel transport system substrate-binding protein
MLKIRQGTTETGARTIGAFSATVLLIAATGCVGSGARSSQAEPVTLKVGFGNASVGIRTVARNIALERLVRNARDGRTQPGLVASWSVSRDGLTWRIRLRPSARFHDGKAADADVIRRIVETRLPEALGPAYEDVVAIRKLSDHELEIVLRKRSTFLMEQLGEFAIEEPGSALSEEPGSALSGTGPFYVSSEQGNEIELRANASYSGGKAAIDRIVIKPYTSVRSAWADMLRGKVDMLYDVGVDALDSLQSSSDVKVFTFQTRYAYMVLLNVQKPYLRDPAFRRQLNAAIDRDALVADALRGHGTPAVTAVWPHHWAYSAELPRFPYDPHPVSGPTRRHLTCIFSEPAYEKLALALQTQLRAIRVDLDLEQVTGKELLTRLETGNFDAFLTDVLQGPNMLWPYLFWHTGAPSNHGHFSSPQVDAALDTIRHAADDSTYQAGVAAFEGAMVNDPPAIFLAWRERARAVSTRFRVPGDAGADVLFTLRDWRPAGDSRATSRN